MSTALLATKLSIPPLRTDSLPRPRLVNALDGGLQCKLTLVAAPAGYGKTTLLSEWVRGIEASVAWLSLDKNDNDLPRFLKYFYRALQTADLEIKPPTSPGLPSPEWPPIEVILTPLLNDLAALDSPAVLVLDDFHFIETEPIHQVLTFLLDQLPPQVHLVIATRVDPHLPIARLRAQMDLVELREVDLRFTPDEMSVFLNQVMGLSLTKDQINKLAARTEGWIVGLQLAGLSMQGKDNKAAFVEAFSGSHEYIVDYLTDEVLKGLSPERQKFLMETSILDQLSGPLCDAVTGQEGGLETLEHLRESHLFVIPLDHQRRWYRYHRLFADHLLKRLRDIFPERISKLHRRASLWHEQNGLIAGAVEHALAVEDYARTAELIEQVAEETMMRSEFALFLQWASALPESIFNTRPMLGIARAMSLLMTGEPVEAVEPLLEELHCETDAHLGGRLVVQAVLAVVRGRLSTAYDLAQQAVGLLSAEENKSLRSVANWIISYTGALESKPSAGIRALEVVVEESRSSDEVMLTVAASFEMAKLYTYQGKLLEAEQILEGAVDQARDEKGNLLPIAGEGLIGLGEIFRERNQLQHAEQTLLSGIELSRWGRRAVAYRGYLSLAKLKLAQDDLTGAYHRFREAKQRAAFEFDRLIVTCAELKARLTQGEIERTDWWLQERGWIAGPRLPDEGDNAIDKHMRKYEHLLHARLFMAREKTSEALASLALLEQMMEQQERIDLLIEINILKALAYQAQDESGEALTAVGAALSLARPGGYVRIFIDEGEAFRPLLLEAAARGVESAYSRMLLATFPTVLSVGPGPVRVAPPNAELVERLTERETQVLRLLASPLTSKDIAVELYISANTVRFHIKNIYSKLGVHRRVEAVDRARELGLL